MNHPQAIRLNKETEEERASYYNKEAAHERRKTINEQIDAFFKSGGKITKLPSYDDNLGVPGNTIYSVDDYESA